ncbi:MAG: chloride channel protein [Prochloraceae cyanobacterium]
MGFKSKNILSFIFSSKLFRRWRYTFKQIFFLEVCLIGLTSGLSAVALKEGIDLVAEWRISLAEQYNPLLILPAIGLLGGLLSGLFVKRFAPSTSGGGIPQVKAYVEGLPVIMNLRIAIVKLIGAVLVLGSGFTLGREGPTIQMSAACAVHLSNRFSHLSGLRRQIVAAGAGAGLAAAFSAPIAGVLFVVEDLRKDASSFTFGTAILGSFVGSVVARQLGAHVHIATDATNFTFLEIPFYILLGSIIGLLGAIFNEGIIYSLKFYRTKLSLPFAVKVGLAGLITGIVLALLSPEFWIGERVLERVLDAENTQLATGTLFLQFGLTIVGYGSGAPGGLFAPTLILGACVGHLVALLPEWLLGIDWQVAYALAGMGAFFCASIRVPITAIAIIFEMTQDFNLVLPLMITCLCAYFIAEKLSPKSLYERLLNLNGIDLHSADDRAPTSFIRLKAKNIMTKEVETLNHRMNMAQTIQIFAQSNHRGFPVLDDEDRLIGIVTQKDVNEFLWQQSISAGVKPDRVLLSQIMTRSPITIDVETPLLDAIEIIYERDFSRIPVMEGDRLVGLITRSDLIRAEANYIKEL